jgi:hypothetical protein
VDADLFEINRAFEQEQHGPVDFYQEPWEPMWKTPKPLKGKGFGIGARADDMDEELDDEDDSSVTEFSTPDEIPKHTDTKQYSKTPEIEPHNTPPGPTAAPNSPSPHTPTTTTTNVYG